MRKFQSILQSWLNVVPLFFAGLLQASPLPEAYDVTWDSPSANSSESMPVGGGDVGANVWVENGDLLFYFSQSGTFDENNSFLKMGRARIELSPNPFDGFDTFEQKLVLNEGHIEVSATKGALTADLKIWVDVFRPVIHVECSSNQDIDFSATYESWRDVDQVIPPAFLHQCFSYTGYDVFPVTTYKDEIAFDAQAVAWHHRNKDDQLLFDFILDQQGLRSREAEMLNTQKGRTFGGMMSGTGLVPDGTTSGRYVDTDFSGWRLSSTAPASTHDLTIVMNTSQTDTLGEWQTQLSDRIAEVANVAATARQATKDWWQQFWDRSHIVISPEAFDPNQAASQIGKNYQLFRYMLGCNAYGDYPSKFNGSLFTFDPRFVGGGRAATPDHRAWGGGSFTAQNQRLSYWPMLKSGDFDMMPSQFNFYRRALHNAEIRTEEYWGHEGCSFTEQVENFGLPFAGGWGFTDAESNTSSRTRLSTDEYGTQTNRFVRYHFVNQLEFSLMILDYYRFSGEDISSYIPFIESSLTFFDEHYRYRLNQSDGQELDNNGKLVVAPSTAAETYRNVSNPTDVLAALQTVLTRVQELPDSLLPPARKAKWASVLPTIADIPTGQVNGHTVIVPGTGNITSQSNMEIPELYSVFPYDIYGLGKPDLQLAIDTYNYGPSEDNRDFLVGWSQAGIFAARLGLTSEAKRITEVKLTDAPLRFPAFWGPGPNWITDFDKGGSGIIGLQEMLLQTSGDEIRVLPAWPSDWPVEFKLHAPNNTTVEGKVENGQLVELVVTPPERMADVIVSDQYLTSQGGAGLVTYTDVTSSNTTGLNGWQERSGFGTNGNVWQASGNVQVDEATTTLTGLNNSETYQVYAFFNVADVPGGTNHWFLQAGLESNNLELFVSDNRVDPDPAGSIISPAADTLNYMGTAPIFDAGTGQTLFAADLGTARPTNGEIQVYFDNPDSLDRVWMDGIGVSPLPSADPPGLQIAIDHDTDEVILEFDSVIGREYFIEGGSDLLTWPDLYESAFLPTSTRTVYRIPMPASSTYFFRVGELEAD